VPSSWHPGSTVSADPPEAPGVIEASGQRSCFQPLLATTSTRAAFVHDV
jgi:hypothetical protein